MKVARSFTEKQEYTLTGRAILLQFLHHHGQNALGRMAEFAGYEPKPRQITKSVQGEADFTPGEQVVPASEYQFAESRGGQTYWYVSEYRNKTADEVTKDQPEWADEKKGGVSENQVQADFSQKSPDMLPLVSWSRIWTLLRAALGTNRESRTIDIRNVIESLSNLKPLKKIPFLSRVGWCPTGCLVLDFDERLLPLWDDLNRIHYDISKLRGRSGLDVYMVENGPEGEFRKRDLQKDPVVDFNLPDPGTPVLFVSDLGCFESTGTITEQWLRFGNRLNRSGIHPVVMTPCPPEYWNERLRRHYALVWWDRGNRSFRPGQAGKYSPKQFLSHPSENDPRVERLLGLLSPAIRVEPALLRAVRMLLPVDKSDAAAEIKAWNHPQVDRSPLAYWYKPETMHLYRDSFRNEPEDLRRKVIALIEQYHAHLSIAVAREEELIAGGLERKASQRTATFFKQYFRTIDAFGSSYSQQNLKAWFNRLIERQSQRYSKEEERDVLSACWLKINLEEWKKKQVSEPQGIDIEKALWLIPDKKKPETYSILQVGSRFVVRGAGAAKSTSNDRFAIGSPVADIQTRKSTLSIEQFAEKRITKTTVPLQYPIETSLPLPENGPLYLSTDLHEIRLNTIMKPKWAEGIGRDGKGVFIQIGGGAKKEKIYWPEWSDVVDYDNYGLYADFILGQVTQRFRWISPGRFLMGSPNDEPERDSDERLHEVELTKGFWLAETACTQALWETVTGENPSHFKGGDRPVETVSWEDGAGFIQTFNSLKPGLNFRLPTEAEWEYACRAGTTTPFSFGWTISPEQVNYDGNHPYAGGKKGIYRQKTVEVKSLPCNAWGFYEMHGNVWEWCSDWFGKYPEKKIVDPKGPDKGVYRVLRGGCWFDYGRDVRSAYRSRHNPGIRSVDIGFRLARGQESGGAG